MDFSSYLAESKENLLSQIATVWQLGAWVGQDQDRVEPPASNRPPKMSRCGRLRDTGGGRLPEGRPQGAKI